jgi:3-oxoacyl-[acyl-carrier protein] reductase/meso-butanediol dehydrogenase/(S,S)-butanediol dehydrogenase/diacetyl reductase
MAGTAGGTAGATADGRAARGVVVTGGSKGIGAGIARAFHAAGWDVTVAARADNGFAASLGPRARHVAMDVRDEAGHAAAADAAMAGAGRIDCWVNCAGVSAWRPVEEIDAAFWDAMVGVNLTGAMWGCKTAAARLGPGGSIVNVSSLAGKRGSARNAAYCAAKFGLNGLTQALAKELGGRGIRVNAVCPVYVVTPGLEEALADDRSPLAGGELGGFLRDFAHGQAALGRLPTDAEVGAACLFLASDAASAITAQCINVDCGVLPS